jgi:hypothetical protein
LHHRKTGAFSPGFLGRLARQAGGHKGPHPFGMMPALFI